MNYRVLVTDESMDDIFILVRYIHVELCNPDAAERLYYNLNRAKLYHFSDYQKQQ